jgi:hypothetical protein
MIENVRGFLDAVFEDYRRQLQVQFEKLGYVSAQFHPRLSRQKPARFLRTTIVPIPTVSGRKPSRITKLSVKTSRTPADLAERAKLLYGDDAVNPSRLPFH